MEQIQNNIKNIIFDLGGVLLNLGVSKSINAFQDLGLKDMIQDGGWDYKNKLFLDMEMGLVSSEEFRQGVREMLPNGSSDEEIDAAWCAMILDFPSERINLLKELGKSYRLFLLSNTNEIHLEYFRDLFRKKYDFEIDDLFEKAFYSHEIKMRKPDVKSFELVLDQTGIKAQETLFIDDSERNIEAATQLGINAIWLQPKMSLVDIFANAI